MGLWDSLRAVAVDAGAAVVQSGSGQLQTYMTGSVDPSAADRLLPPGVAPIRPPAAVLPVMETQAPSVAPTGEDSLGRPVGVTAKLTAFAKTKVGMAVLGVSVLCVAYLVYRKKG